MEFPKMLYRSAKKHADQEALKKALATGEVQTLVVKSVEEQEAAEEWTEDLASLIRKPAGRPAQADKS